LPCWKTKHGLLEKKVLQVADILEKYGIESEGDKISVTDMDGLKILKLY
jgi:hypothetical protein